MARDSINYGDLMHQALQGVLASVLSEIAEDGLPGEHHLYITFRTNHPGVDIPDWLREQHPGEMIIVLQNWFSDLEVTGECFGVTLNFNGQPERLVVPFDAITVFVDPSVEFGLRFDAREEQPAEAEDSEGEDPASIGGPRPVDTDSQVTTLTPKDAEFDEESGGDGMWVAPAATESSGSEDEDDDEEAESGQIVNLDRFRKT
ncbi:MAG: ClpXP protease specificity-enhancing factor SspB [Pseudomonadota bacterium]